MADDRQLRVLLPLPGNESFAAKLAEHGHELGRLETRRFPDGESYVRVLTDVSGRDVDLVCTLARPDEGLLTLLFAADAVRSLGALSVTLIAPYLAYMRQDRSFKDGEAVTSRTFARVLSSSFDWLVTVDPHLHRYKSLSSIYAVPSVTLHAAPLLADWVAANVRYPILIGPDEESEQWVSAIAARVGAPHEVTRKIRYGDRRVDVQMPDLRKWKGRQPVLVDDIVSSGETLIEASRELRRQRLPRPICVVVHPVFARDSFDRLQAVASRIVSSDTIPHPSNVISVAALVASAPRDQIRTGPELIRKRRQPVHVDGGGQA